MCQMRREMRAFQQGGRWQEGRGEAEFWESSRCQVR